MYSGLISLGSGDKKVRQWFLFFFFPPLSIFLFLSLRGHLASLETLIVTTRGRSDIGI